MKNFKNEITWHRCISNKPVKSRFSANTDVIFFYSKTENHIFNPQFLQLREGGLKPYNQDDNDGKGLYRWVSVDAPSGKHFQYRNYPTPKRGYGLSIEKLDALFEKGLLSKDERKICRRKYYLTDSKGSLADNLWIDFNNIQGSENLDYPTQKPEALLERIILASSNTNTI